MPTILVVDDDAFLVSSMKAVLEFEGYSAVTVLNGRAALEQIAAARPDLILCDVMMPELDGYGVLAAIRGDPALASIPIVFMSATPIWAVKKELGDRLSIDGYLTKPFEIPEMLVVIKRLLSS